MHREGLPGGAGQDVGQTGGSRAGFTLIELLVVVLIIGLVSALTLPTVIHSLSERQVVSAATLLQAGLVQARDAATGAGTQRRGDLLIRTSEAETLRGLRLVPERVTRLADGTIDPDRPLVCSELVPLAIPQAYQEGAVSIVPSHTYPATLTGGRPCLVLEQSPGHWVESGGGWVWIPHNPTSWAWNLRAGEKVTINGGPAYTIVGPMAVLPGDGNPEAFVNYGAPGVGSGVMSAIASPAGQVQTTEVEVLLLVNARDDDGDGFTDDGWDGLDNDGDGLTDEPDEWEIERWLGQQEQRATTDATYRVIRRPAPSGEPRGVRLPANIVIDLTGWGGTAGRSRVLVDRWSGTVDLMLDRAGRWSYDLPYSGTSAIGMGKDAWVHLWLGAREDIADPSDPMPAPKKDARLLTVSKAGLVSVQEVNPDDPGRAYLDARRGER